NHSFSDGSATSSEDLESPPPPPKFRNNNPRTSSSGFDPEPLIKGAKTLNDIANSPHGKNVFENIKKREDEKQSEIAQKTAEFNQMKALHEA
ncbi:ATPase family AAA domain-containing protein 3-B-like, partial [Trifolium medium]|nr:ATPase family AAA domain-containing protein 3-B-like [Trifolium medium]